MKLQFQVKDVYTGHMATIYAAEGVDIKEAFPLAKNGFSSLAGLVSFFFPKALLMAGIIFFLMTIGAGFRMVMGAGGGDPHAQEQAKNFFTLSITGLVIIFAAYWILQIISFVTGGSLKDVVGF